MIGLLTRTTQNIEEKCQSSETAYTGEKEAPPPLLVLVAGHGAHLYEPAVKAGQVTAEIFMNTINH